MEIQETALNYKGEKMPTVPPLKKVLAVAAGGRIHLSSDGKNNTQVVYGLQSKRCKGLAAGLAAGLAEFACCMHHCRDCGDL